MQEYLPAILTFFGTTLALIAPRIWQVKDKRQEELDAEMEECSRYKTAFRPLMHYARQKAQCIIALNIRMKDNPDYAIARLDELANESTMILDELRDYVEGRGEYPQSD
jgi:hypothetical protein